MNKPLLIISFVTLVLFASCHTDTGSEPSPTSAQTANVAEVNTNAAPPRSPSPKTRDGLGWMQIRDDYYAEDQWRWQIPSWAYEQIEGTETEKKYDLSNEFNPFLINGDFDGDGQYDVAVLTENRKDAQDWKVLVVHKSGGHHLFEFGGPNWELYPKGPVYQGVGEGPPPKLIGDALLFVKPESASSLYYWDGKGYKHYQQGD